MQFNFIQMHLNLWIPDGIASSLSKYSFQRQVVFVANKPSQTPIGPHFSTFHKIFSFIQLIR